MRDWFKLRDLEKGRVLFRARELSSLDRFFIADDPSLNRFTRGLYASDDSDITLTEALLFRTPHAIACLDSALWLHEVLGDEPPRVRIAISRDARKPKVENDVVETYRWSEPAHPDDIVEIRRGPPNHPWVKAFGLAKTAIDLLRARRRFGVALAYDWVDHLLGRFVTVDELHACAARYRASVPLRDYFRRNGLTP